jgi:protein SCO1/2
VRARAERSILARDGHTERPLVSGAAPVTMRYAWLAMAVAAVALAFAVARLAPWRDSDVAATNAPDIGGAFELVDHTGRAVTQADFAGDFMLVYFGFTSCPDICPTAMQAVAQALDDLGGKAARVRPVLITVDPERDTPAVLADYVANFHPRLVGLTGTPEQVAAAARAYKVYYAKVPSEEGDYVMDHSAILYLMGPDGRYIRHFTHGDGADEIAAALREAL